MYLKKVNKRCHEFEGLGTKYSSYIYIYMLTCCFLCMVINSTDNDELNLELGWLCILIPVQKLISDSMCQLLEMHGWNTLCINAQWKISRDIRLTFCRNIFYGMLTFLECDNIPVAYTRMRCTRKHTTIEGEKKCPQRFWQHRCDCHWLQMCNIYPVGKAVSAVIMFAFNLATTAHFDFTAIIARSSHTVCINWNKP